MTLKVSMRFVWATIALASFSLPACDKYACGESHSSTQTAIALPQGQLAALFAEAEAHAKRPPTDFNGIPIKTQLPEFAIKQPVLTMYSSDATVKLAGCFDHGVYLSLDGLNKPDGSITLFWGEGPEPGEKLLWSKAHPDAGR